jgi:hypothetical protein
MSQPEERTVSKDGYEVTFHPAFASRCDVSRKDGTSVELYRQEGIHQHPQGGRHPKRHRISLKGGRDGRDLSLSIDDPKAEIAKITIELYDPSHEAGWGRGDEPVETFTVMNDAFECPPYCITDDDADRSGGDGTV